MRIAHITATFSPYRGGTGNVCFGNARELARRGHEVHVFTAAVAGVPPLEQRDGFTIHRLRPLLRVGNAPVLPGLLTELRSFDLLHLHYPFFGGELTTLVAIATRTPLIVTYHQDVFLHGFRGLIERALRHSVGRLTLRSAARILFTSTDYGRASYVQPVLRDRGQRVAALPNGVDTQRFAPAAVDPHFRAALRLAPTDRVALLVAGLDQAHYFKGVNHFLGALALLPDHVRAVIVGDGDLRASYAEQARRLGIDKRVIFAGRVPDAVLPTFYQLADVAVLPSITMGEAFGLVLVEALACGTPVIATNLPGVRTVVDHGQNGLLVAPNNVDQLAAALHELLNAPDRARAMGEYGRAQVVARYDWRSVGAQLEAIYAAVLHEYRGTPLVARGEP